MLERGHPAETIVLSLEDIIPDPNQPRKDFDEARLKELAESIRQHGLLRPILVRPFKDGKFELVHGERRWRACKIAGMRKIRAEVRNVNDKEKVEIQLVENLQRQNLNPIEEAETFQRLIDQFGYTHEEQRICFQQIETPKPVTYDARRGEEGFHFGGAC